jgi:carboxypeptidase T
MARHRVTVVARDYEALADLVRRYRIGVVRQTARPLRGVGFRVQAVVDSANFDVLRAAGYRLDVLEDLDAEGRVRQREVSAARATRATAGPAAASHYLDVGEIEAALEACATDNPGITTRIALPNPTWEGRQCHALRVGAGAEGERLAIYLLGGIHAREWGSPDILIAFIDRLIAAYRGGTGITLGHKKITATQVKTIVNTKHVYVLPQANPDGRHYSMTVEAMWRKNRRPAASSGPAAGCGGVDLNRNYDFLWDFRRHFHPDAPLANSTDPCDEEIYVGPAAVSEPETKNVVWLLDRNQCIRYLIDIHSYGEMILYNWGDDQDQTTTSAMNFLNPAYDGKRGLANDAAYREYITSADRKTAVKLATKMQAAIKAVRGRTYKVQQSMSLYPTAGTSDDYAFSRHLADPGKPKTYGFTIEWGPETNPTPFHPAYTEMAKIIDEVLAGLLDFCRVAT